VAINSRAKGSRGERLVIALIVPWWKQLEPEFEAARTPLSGGWQGRGAKGQSLRGEMKMSGDLMTTSSRFPFSVEVKNAPDWKLYSIQCGRPSPVWKWWCQCQDAAAECGQVPMMWFRHLRESWNVFLPFDYATRVPIRPPKIVWTKRDLLRVNYGELLPILLDAATVLAVDPRRLALAKRKRVSP
jgi:hypothetical protein